MTVCPRPSCKKRHFKRFENEDGTVYYECVACKYKTKIIYPLLIFKDNINKVI